MIRKEGKVRKSNHFPIFFKFFTAIMLKFSVMRHLLRFQCHLAVGFLLCFTSFATASFRTQSIVPLFAQVGNDYRQVASLPVNFSFQRTDRKVQFGNSWGDIPADYPLREGAETPPHSPKSPTLGYILLKKSTLLFDEQHQPTEISLSENLRYPYTAVRGDWYQIYFNDEPYLIRKAEAEIDNGVPVITYHHLLKDSENKKYTKTSTTTSNTAFELNLRIMQERGFSSLDFYQLEGFLKGTANIPAKAVVLTFDDGLKSVYRYAYPLLKKYGFKATMFTITSRIKYYEQTWDPDELQFLSKDDYLAMSDHFDWQSHTHFLHNYRHKRPLLTQTDVRGARLDFERSLRELQQFNPTPAYLSYPFGVYNEQSIQAAKQAGIRMAVTTKVGRVKFGDDPYQLKRVYLLRDDGREKIIHILENE